MVVMECVFDFVGGCHEGVIVARAMTLTKVFIEGGQVRSITPSLHTYSRNFNHS